MASNPEPLAAATSRIQKTVIHNAVTSLLKLKSAAQSATGKLQLLPDDDYLYLNITLKKIPSNPRTSPFKIPLPHPILDAASQVCLIIDDRPKSPTPPSDQIKKLVKSLDIPIAKVIKISKLKTNYKPFEAKRKLCDSYDLFLVDKRVVHLLPKLLGKEFFRKKKLPLGVDLGMKNLKLQVERALGSALLYLRTGTCCVMKVGKMAMEKDEIVENVFAAVSGAVERVGKKWDGVRSLFLKFSDTLALPIYQVMPDVKLKIEGLKEVDMKAELELELAKSSDNEGELKDVSGGKDGGISKKRNKKGRIHEVHYMDIESGDDDVDESEKIKSDDEIVEDVSVGKKGKALKGSALEESSELKKKSKGKKDVFLSGDGGDKVMEDDGLSVDVSVGEEVRKEEALKEGDLGVSNGLKRKAKGKSDGLPSEDVLSVGKKKKKTDLGEMSSEVKDVKKLSEDVPAEGKGKKKKRDLGEMSNEVKDVKKLSEDVPAEGKGKKKKRDPGEMSNEVKDVEKLSEDVPAEAKGKKKKRDLGEMSNEVKDVKKPCEDVPAKAKGKKKTELEEISNEMKDVKKLSEDLPAEAKGKKKKRDLGEMSSAKIDKVKDVKKHSEDVPAKAKGKKKTELGEISGKKKKSAK